MGRFLCVFGVSLGLAGCVAAEPIDPGVSYGGGSQQQPAPEDGLPAADRRTLAVLSNNPNATLHVFTDAAGRRFSLAVASSVNNIVPLLTAQPPASAELWRVDRLVDGTALLRQPLAANCLTLTGGALSAQACSASPTQTWRILPVLFGDTARLQNVATDQCVGLSTDAATVVLAACGAAPMWRFELVVQGNAVPATGFGKVTFASTGSTVAGAAATRPCTEAFGTFADPNLISWLEVNNTTGDSVTLDRYDTSRALIGMTVVAPNSVRVVQVPAGSVVRLSINGLCKQLVDTAAMIRLQDANNLQAQGATLHPCSAFGTLVSQASLRPALMRTYNTSGQTVSLFWLDYGGAPVSYGAVDPAVISSRPTYQGHPWMLRDAGGACVGIFSIAADPKN